MTTVDQLLGANRSGGVFLTDPRDLLRWAVPNVSLLKADPLSNPPSFLTPGDSGFDTIYGASGVSISSSWTANTFKTVVNVTGRGLLHNILGPLSPIGGTASIRVTVDGNAFDINLSALPAGMRQYLGFLVSVEDSEGASDGVGIKANRDMLGHRSIPVSSMVDGHYIQSSDDIGLPSAEALYRTNQILAFEESLKVEARIGNVASMAGGDRLAGVQYRML